METLENPPPKGMLAGLASVWASAGAAGCWVQRETVKLQESPAWLAWSRMSEKSPLIASWKPWERRSATSAEVGAKEASPVGDEHGLRIGRIIDPSGHEWEIGKPLG